MAVPPDQPLVLLTHPQHRLNDYYGEEALAGLRAVAEVRLNLSDDDLAGDALVQAAQGCDVIVAYRQTAVPAAAFAFLPNLKAIVRCAVDIRTIDVDAASRFGVLVTQASPGFMASVAEWVIAVMIDLSRHISVDNLTFKTGVQPQPRMGRELRGATLGVIGYGQISRYLCRLAQAFDMRVLVNDPYAAVDGTGVSGAPLADVLAQSDYVVCLAPATAETENLMDERAFAQMKKGAFFVNAARGNLVDESALLQALDAGRLAGAALDVGRAADQMPGLLLASHPMVIATPHTGGLTLPATRHQALETVAQTAKILQGRLPAGAVNGPHANRFQQAFRQ